MNIAEYRPSPNTYSTRKARGTVETTVFWERTDGEVMMAPHTALKPFPGYRRVECNTASEIARYSRKLEKQELAKVKMQRVDEHLRNHKRREQVRASARLRIAQNFSPMDIQINQRILQNMDRQDESFYRYIKESATPLQGGLMIEKHEKPAIDAIGKKKTELE